jgi:hypothetical protein
MCVRPDHERQSFGRLKSNRQFPSLMNACPDHSFQTSGRWYLNCNSCLKETRIQTGYHIVRTVDRSSLYWNLERIWDCSSTERRSNVLLKRPDKCKLDRTFSIQYSVQMEWSRRPDGWCWSVLAVRTVRHVVQTDGTVDRWASRRDGSIVRKADRKSWILLTSKQNRLRSLWIVESLFTASLHISDFVQTQNEAKILTETKSVSCWIWFGEFPSLSPFLHISFLPLYLAFFVHV